MKPLSVTRRVFTFLMLFAFAFSLPGPLGRIPSVEAATTSSTALVRKLKTQIARMGRQIARLKRELAEARAVPPTPAPFIEMVAVGNPGNAADSTTYGAVPYDFKIGKAEVTLAQYTSFLNAVAATDTHALYNAAMAIDLNSAGINQNGSPGSFTYVVIGDGARPVTYVSWFDAARFCNWLHNGRRTGAQDQTTTERGAYTLDGATSGVGFVRAWGAKFGIPGEDEWYKAAYHDSRTAAAGGPDGDSFYWLYPMMTNGDPGNTIGALPNQSNFFSTVYSVTQNATLDPILNYLSAVGSYSGSASFSGTFDQGGNVYEWTDAVDSGSSRVLRGGSWRDAVGSQHSSSRNQSDPALDYSSLGFRVASP